MGGKTEMLMRAQTVRTEEEVKRVVNAVQKCEGSVEACRCYTPSVKR
jgi:hypothetical protein